METMYKKYENKPILPVRPFPKTISMANHMAWYSFAYAIKQWHYGHIYALIQKTEQNTMTFLFVKKRYERTSYSRRDCNPSHYII